MPEQGHWPSQLQIDAIFARQGAPAYPFYSSHGQLFWLESLSDDKGRMAICTLFDGATVVVTPAAYQVRTAVHEYGGKAFCVFDDVLYFNNSHDGSLYYQRLPTPAQLQQNELSDVQLLANGGEGHVGFADLSVNPAINCLLAVQERSREGQENENCLSLIKLTANLQEIGQVQTVVSGADFYACPCISANGKQIAWLQWQHPNMPWDATELHIADLNIDAATMIVEATRCLDGSDGNSALCQLNFLGDGSLVYAKDSDQVADVLGQTADGYWNLYRCTFDEADSQPQVEPLTTDEAEYGEAHWVFGQRRWLQVDAQHLIAVRTSEAGDELVQVPLQGGVVKSVLPVCASLVQLSQMPQQTSIVCAVAYYADQEPAVVQVNLTQNNHASVLHAVPDLLSQAAISLGEMHAYPTQDGAQAFANFYPPKNPVVEGEFGPAPAIVMVHGGPTSRATRSLSLLVQYFTGLGFAVIDVNHRGSTGQGRAYRQSLLGGWGEIDASDIRDAIAYFVGIDLVDANKVCIRGGSAGGYAVLRALTRYGDLFCAGACYYGIGNLITLSEITHKFESHYTDRLIDEVFTPETARKKGSAYISRSPIFEMDQISSPVILFQGLDDKVVPPAVSHEVVQVLKRRGIDHEYVEYAGEGHGFRQAANRIDALNKEVQFYQRILKQQG